MAIRKIFGGSFAPPLTPEKLNSYTELANTANDIVKEIMLKLIAMIKHFNLTPSSPLVGTEHATKLALIIPLEDKEIERIWDVIPWEYEIDSYSAVCDSISNETHKDLRNAAFHLIWFARELCADREPITNDKLIS